MPLRKQPVPQALGPKRGRVKVTVNMVHPNLMFAEVRVGAFKQRTAMVEGHEPHLILNDVLEILGFVTDVRVAEFQC